MKQLMLDKGKKLIREKLADYIAALKEGKLATVTSISVCIILQYYFRVLSGINFAEKGFGGNQK